MEKNNHFLLVGIFSIFIISGMGFYGDSYAQIFNTIIIGSESQCNKIGGEWNPDYTECIIRENIIIPENTFWVIPDGVNVYAGWPMLIEKGAGISLEGMKSSLTFSAPTLNHGVILGGTPESHLPSVYAHDEFTNCGTVERIGTSKDGIIIDCPRKLTLVKIVENFDQAGAFPYDFKLSATGPTSFSGFGPSISSGDDFAEGSYVLAESGELLSSYTNKGWSCINTKGKTAVSVIENTVKIGGLDDITCTITNTLIPKLTESDPEPPVEPVPEDDPNSVFVDANNADLELTKKVDNSFPELYDTITFTITLSNNGPGDATNVLITDKFPYGFSPQFLFPDETAKAHCSEVEFSTELLIHNCDIPKGISFEIDVVGAVYSLPFANSAEITSSDKFDPDSTPNNNIPSEDDQDSVSVQGIPSTVQKDGAEDELELATEPTPEPPVEEDTPEPPVEEDTPEPPVEEDTPEPPVEEPNRTIETEKPIIPAWMKGPVGFWVEGKTSDAEFKDAIQFMINEGLIVVPSTEVTGSSDIEIPEWIKGLAGFWIEEKTTDVDFVNGLTFLIEKGIIVVGS